MRTSIVAGGQAVAIASASALIFLGIASAQAADWSNAAPTWSGSYVGIHAGGTWGSASVTDTNGGVDPGPFNYSASGAFGGATAGWNGQSGGLVAGVEGDLGYMNLTGAGIIPSSHPGEHQDATLTGGLYGDLTGRLGFATGSTLIYGKAGFAFYAGKAQQLSTYQGYVPSPTGTFTGWTIGAGFEQKLGSNMSWKIEYLHFDFGSQDGSQTSTFDPPVPYVYTNSTSLKADSVKIGLNWALGAP